MTSPLEQASAILKAAEEATPKAIRRAATVSAKIDATDAAQENGK